MSSYRRQKAELWISKTLSEEGPVSAGKYQINIAPRIDTFAPRATLLFRDKQLEDERYSNPEGEARYVTYLLSLLLDAHVGIAGFFYGTVQSPQQYRFSVDEGVQTS